MASIHLVEFYGIPRERAGRGELNVEGDSLAEILTDIQRCCPRLKDIHRDGAVSPHYRISLNGERFLTDLEEILPVGSHVLVLSADAGG